MIFSDDCLNPIIPPLIVFSREIRITISTIDTIDIDTIDIGTTMNGRINGGAIFYVMLTEVCSFLV